jgi:hypothetical protein
MMFKAFKCSCGYVCITPEDRPLCHDCQKPLIPAASPEEARIIEGKLARYYRKISNR